MTTTLALMELSLLPDGIDPAVALLLLATSFLASLITVAFGIGGGGLLLAVMASLMPPAALIPVHGLVQLGSNAGRMGLLLGAVSRPALPAFALGSVVGCIAGGLVVVDLPAHVIQIAVGAFVIWSVFARAPRWVGRAPLLTGLISSVLTMFFGATGLFVASYTKSLHLPRHAHVATHAALMTIQHGLKTLVFGALGFAFADWGLFIAAMILAGLAGTFTGRLFLDRIAEWFFRIALDVLLVLIAARLILAGLGLIG
ncbi:TSUP family transporter [Poseidonocella sedimentorum]|uniref:Probable membrane transporter protein n=1 Tax=Poseidonocella sedimentorum TaxID=871652 RepID=A0A1I6E484_9RHOB|nr:TSUP family transporter [Poseidonocella sedimentorum]SFR12560.1 Sulfite exporter TauE/SafE [Poseidonocella sedimentorum]